MVSIVRSAVLRQSVLASVSRSAFSAKTAGPALARPAFRGAFQQNTVRVAAFHASNKRSILPAGPQKIEGTANDAAHVPAPSPTHGSYHWTFERLVSIGLIPLTVAPFAAGSLNPATDAILCAAILIHSHIGFEACITDYIPKREMPGVRKTFDWLLKIATVVVGVGLYEFETNDVGLTEGIRRVWTA